MQNPCHVTATVAGHVSVNNCGTRWGGRGGVEKGRRRRGNATQGEECEESLVVSWASRAWKEPQAEQKRNTEHNPANTVQMGQWIFLMFVYPLHIYLSCVWGSWTLRPLLKTILSIHFFFVWLPPSFLHYHTPPPLNSSPAVAAADELSRWISISLCRSSESSFPWSCERTWGRGLKIPTTSACSSLTHSLLHVCVCVSFFPFTAWNQSSHRCPVLVFPPKGRSVALHLQPQRGGFLIIQPAKGVSV